jgi:hypothetical protein
MCKKDYAELDKSSLTWFEEKVCLNKSSIISAIALMFIFTIVTSLIKKKFNKKEKIKDK